MMRILALFALLISSAACAQFEPRPGGGTATVPPFNNGLAGGVNRTINAKLGDTVSVVDFGGNGNGIADNCLAVRAATNAVSAAGGGTIYFPPGTYSFACTPTGPAQ